MRMLSKSECYRRLDIRDGASWSEVKSAFRKKARLYHPDISRKNSSYDFERVSEAYMTLRDYMKHGETVDSHGNRASKSKEEKKDYSWLSGFSKAKEWVFDFADEIHRKRKRKQEERERIRREERDRIRSLIDSIIGEAEVHLEGVISKVGRPGGPSDREIYLQRLGSKLPEVRNLALQRLMPSLSSVDVFKAVEESFYLYGVDDVGFDILMSETRDGLTDLRFAMAIVPHFSKMSQGCAKRFIRWIDSLDGTQSVYVQLLDHPSPEIVSYVISRWPSSLKLPPAEKISFFFEKGENLILIPLLRLINKKGCPKSLLSKITLIYQKSDSSSVKAWANAIVCKSTVV